MTCSSFTRSSFAWPRSAKHRELKRLVCILSCFAVMIGCDRAPTSTSPPAASSAEKSSTTTAAATTATESPVEVVYEDQSVTDEQLTAWISNVSLRRLKLAKSSTSDEDLRRLTALKQLEYLDLTDCQSITNEGLPLLAEFKSLKQLRISGPSVTDQTIDVIAALNNLAALSLQHANITDASMSRLTSLSKLKELNLYGSPITDQGLAPLSQLPQLQKLRLRGTQVTGVNAAALASLPLCSDLDLSETGFTSEGLKHVAEMPKLRQLNLWLTKVDDAGIDHLQKKRDLTLLNLDNVKSITNRSLDVIGQMQDLELLHLGGTSVTAEAIPKLYPLRKLKTLFVTRLGLQDPDVQALREAMPWVTRLES